MNVLTRATAFRWLEEGRPAIVVVVLESHGSVPCNAGTRMLVSGGEAVGTVGGGQLELRAISEARALLQSGSAARSVQYKLVPAHGAGCGGSLTLGFMRLDGVALSAWPEPRPLFQLQIYGTGHVAHAVARLLYTLDCRVDWIDEREDGFPHWLFEGARWPAHIRTIAADDLPAEVRNAPADAYHLVLTQDYDLDLLLTETILRRGDFGFLGLLGSLEKRQTVVQQLEQRGVPGERIARLTCPVGLPGIGGKAPELIALGVVAQLLHEEE